MSVEDIHIESTLTTGTYSIDDFNGKVKAPVIQQRQDWEAPQTKKSKNYIFMVSNRFFIALGILINYLQRGPHVTSQLYPLAHIKYLLIHHLPLYKYLYTVNKSIELKTR